MKTTAQRSDFAFFHELPTRWGDQDPLGHVNNARYFTYDESARLAFLETLSDGEGNYVDGQGPILAHIGCDFLVQLHHPATLQIGYRITRIGRTSLQTQSALFVGEALVATMRAVLVWFDYDAQQPAPVPESVKTRICERSVIPPELA